MAAFNKFEVFVGDLGTGVYDFNATGHEIRVYASNAAASSAADVIKTDVAEIAAANGYTTQGSDIQNTWSEATGTGTLAATDVVWTATTAGSFGPLQYIPMFNETSTAPADPLIGWWDYGSAVTVNALETFTVDFGASVLTLA